MSKTSSERDTKEPSGGTSPTPDQVRTEVREWLRQHWNPRLSLMDWRSILVDSGWARPSWEADCCGRALPEWADELVNDEFATAGAVTTPVNGAMMLASATIRQFGPDHLRKRFLRPLLTGEETWCQLFSEPEAGSDLAGLKARAVLDGDHWVLNGQKLWSTSAHHADLAMLLARTGGGTSRHSGITFFALPMKQAGVDVRPLRQMNGHSSFNEVFFTDVRIPAENVVGRVGDGWRVAMFTLGNERRLGALKWPEHLSGDGPAVVEARREAEEYFESYKWYPQRAGRVDLVLEHARLSGRSDNPVVRQEIARLLSMHKVATWTAERAKQAELGTASPAAGSIQKLLLSQVAAQAARVHTLLGGISASVSGPGSGFDGMIAEVLVSYPAQSIAGGTDEIQRNIIGERVLGLPREPDVT